jgi:hypothetical protein
MANAIIAQDVLGPTLLLISGMVNAEHRLKGGRE